MKRLPWAVLVVLGGVACVNLVATGCGSDETALDQVDGGGDDGSNPPPNPNPNPNPPPTSGDGGGGDGSGDGAVGDADADALDYDATFDATLDGDAGDALACKLSGDTCAVGADCCTGNCADDGMGGKICGNPINACTPTGNACPANPTDCCLGACFSGLCGKCVDNNGACSKSSDCCGGGTCVADGMGGGICQAINCSPAPCTPSCRTTGNSCAVNGDCCSNFCNSGVCSQVSFCTQNGDVCASDNDCCGGACNKPAGSPFGTCGTVSATGAGNCTPSGVLCGTGTECDMSCCSHACGPFGAAGGQSICEPPSGCKPTGEICRGDSDCCGWSGAPPPVIGAETCNKKDPSQTFGKCSGGKSCNEPGIICKAPMNVCNGVNNCCEPHLVDGGAVPNSFCNSDPANCCREDALGIPRCLMVASDCTANPPPPGTTCATSADCCGNPCVGNKCLGACVPAGAVCTTTADCCAGITCNIPIGSSTGICNGTVLPDGGVSDAAPESGPPDDSGTDSGIDSGPACSLFGQTCNVTSDCCNTASGIQCINKSCHFP
ncbi:MAG TPA: hypothetical protein VIF62_03900 [Labilithrix sp.]|jgi:hypothetical protein